MWTVLGNILPYPPSEYPFCLVHEQKHTRTQNIPSFYHSTSPRTETICHEQIVFLQCYIRPHNGIGTSFSKLIIDDSQLIILFHRIHAKFYSATCNVMNKKFVSLLKKSIYFMSDNVSNKILLRKRILVRKKK